MKQLNEFESWADSVGGEFLIEFADDKKTQYVNRELAQRVKRARAEFPDSASDEEALLLQTQRQQGDANKLINAQSQELKRNKKQIGDLVTDYRELEAHTQEVDNELDQIRKTTQGVQQGAQKNLITINDIKKIYADIEELKKNPTVDEREINDIQATIKQLRDHNVPSEQFKEVQTHIEKLKDLEKVDPKELTSTLAQLNKLRDSTVSKDQLSAITQRINDFKNKNTISPEDMKSFEENFKKVESLKGIEPQQLETWKNSIEKFHASREDLHKSLAVVDRMTGMSKIADSGVSKMKNVIDAIEELENDIRIQNAATQQQDSRIEDQEKLNNIQQKTIDSLTSQRERQDYKVEPRNPWDYGVTIGDKLATFKPADAPEVRAFPPSPKNPRSEQNSDEWIRGFSTDLDNMDEKLINMYAVLKPDGKMKSVDQQLKDGKNAIKLIKTMANDIDNRVRNLKYKGKRGDKRLNFVQQYLIQKARNLFVAHLQRVAARMGENAPDLIKFINDIGQGQKQTAVLPEDGSQINLALSPQIGDTITTKDGKLLGTVVDVSANKIQYKDSLERTHLVNSNDVTVASGKDSSNKVVFRGRKGDAIRDAQGNYVGLVHGVKNGQVYYSKNNQLATISAAKFAADNWSTEPMIARTRGDTQKYKGMKTSDRDLFSNLNEKTVKDINSLAENMLGAQYSKYLK